MAEVFEANFVDQGEGGAAFSAMVDGRQVVDIWGGTADVETGEPWQEDTIQLIFSGTKGFSALCMAMLLDRGLFTLDDCVAQHWPEFGQNGKESTTVAEALSHRARVPVLLPLVPEAEILDSERMLSLLAAQAPQVDPRSEVIYHAQTFGWLCDGLMRRIDGRSIGRFFAEEVAEPLDLDIWIGLPEEQESRVAPLLFSAAWGESVIDDEARLASDSLYASVQEEPPLFVPSSLGFFNSRAYRRAELGASGGIGTARSISRLYGALALGGELDGVRIISSDALGRATQLLATEKDPLGLGNPETAYGAGFTLQANELFGPAKHAFGNAGAGGSCHGAWPDERAGFSYAMNELRAEWNTRAAPLLEALHRSIAG